MSTSADGSIVTLKSGGAITDSHGNAWTISASGQVVENGSIDQYTPL